MHKQAADQQAAQRQHLAQTQELQRQHSQQMQSFERQHAQQVQAFERPQPAEAVAAEGHVEAPHGDGGGGMWKRRTPAPGIIRC